MVYRAARVNSYLENTSDAEPVVVVRVSRVVVVTIGNCAVVGVVVPATTPFHPV